MFNRRHWAGLILLSTSVAVVACGDTNPTIPGPRGPGEERSVRAWTIQVLIENRSPWDLSLFLEGDRGDVALGTVGARSEDIFAVVPEELGDLGAFTRVRAESARGVTHSEYRPALRQILVVFDERGEALEAQECYWEAVDVCRL